jgi:ubiquinone/menaquinone biosynthesis C-methylase UbiE
MSTGRTIATYDRIAARYAARATYPLERELARFKHMVPKGGLILDVGCGAGQCTRALDAGELLAVGLDLSLGMLRQAQKNGVSRLVQADMRRLPFFDGCITGCFVCASLLHLPRHQVPQALLELRRVLCSEGALYVGVKEGTGEERVVDREGHERFFVYYRPKEMDRLVETAGFQIVDGWISPPGEDQTHNWINQFAVAQG